ncbi:MAG: hypothetical protein ACRD15_05600 [Vicinamibacterales bacterium]
MIIFSGAIPVAPEDLDFAGATPRDQLHALSGFSQMVNAIPSPPYDYWAPSGMMSWDIYRLVLTQSLFAQATSTAVAAARRDSPKMIDVLASDPQAQMGEAGVAAAAISPAEIWASLENAGFGFSGSQPEPFLDAPTTTPIEPSADSRTGLFPGSEDTAQDARALGLQGVFGQLRAQLDADQMIDLNGAGFYPTRFYPADFYAPANDFRWRAFQVQPGDNNPWAPLAQGGAVKGEMVVVPMQRPWWSFWVFSSRGWKFQPSSGFGVLCDGKTPPSGMMPAYATSLAIARNIQPLRPAASVAPAHLLVVPGNAATPTSGTSTGTSMMIIGFICTPLPLSPNPDPSLNWGS